MKCGRGYSFYSPTRQRLNKRSRGVEEHVETIRQKEDDSLSISQ